MTTNRLVASAIALVIISTTLTFAYGISTETLDKVFSFGLVDQIAKFLLTVGMLIIAFFPRPRSKFHRFVIGSIATLVIGFATYGALASTLQLGDAILLTIGALIAAMETTEQPITRRSKKIRQQLNVAP